MAALDLDRVTKIYGARDHGLRAVDAVTMAVKDGEIIGLLGSSGCGKTSTLRMIAGFESVTEGEVRLGGRVINQLPPARRNVAMAFEGYALYPPLRVRDNIGFSLLRDKRPKAEVEAKVREIAELLAITDILDRYPPTISGGQAQRTSLARALVRQADLYLLDEPMSQLEPQLRAILRARIKDFLIQRRMTTVFVTHDQTEALALADRIAVMEAGVLQQFATPQALKDRPANLFVASFIGEPPMNIFAARIARDDGSLRLTAEIEDGRDAFSLALPGAEAGALAQVLAGRSRVRLGIRPHLVEVGDDGELAGTVITNQWLGDQTHIGVEIRGATLIAVADGTLAAPVESRVRLVLPVKALHLFDAETGVALMHGLEVAAPGVQAA